MELSGTCTYNAPISSVVAMLRDRAETVAKYESMGHRDVEILELRSTKTGLRVSTRRVVDVDLPGFAKRFLKPTNTMVQTDEWTKDTDGVWHGTFDVEVHGAPIHISGTMLLAPKARTTVHDVTITVDAHVPLVGGRLAEWAGKNDVRRSLDAEFAFNKKHVGQHKAA